MTRKPKKTAEVHSIDSEILNRVFAAIADPVRRQILEILDGEELLVSQIAIQFDISMQAVSKHIQVLVKAGLIEQERTGRVSLCRLDAGPIANAAVWINQYSKYWQNQFDTLVAFLPELETQTELTEPLKEK